VLFQNISKKNFTENNINEDLFFKVLNTGFAHKRKMLLSNLKDLQKEKNLVHININEIFLKLNLDLKIRAEKLTVGDWVGIVREF